MDNYLVSIIVPNYNHAPFLEKRLDSIFNQTYQNFEVILLDDCSTDNSWDILSKYKDHPKVTHCIRNDSNSGSPFAQWKKGLELAKGDWIWIAESDDYSDINYLNILINQYLIDNSIGLIYCQSLDIDYNDEVKYDRLNYTENFIPNIWENDFNMSGLEFINNYLSFKNVIPNASAVLFKKPDNFINLFIYELLNMKMCGDWFFWIKILSNNKLAFVSNHLNFFRDHKGITRNHNNKERYMLRLIEEAIIRKNIKNELNIEHLECNCNLYTKWFSLHNKSILSIFKKKIYSVNLGNNKITFFFSYIKYLISN